MLMHRVVARVDVSRKDRNVAFGKVRKDPRRLREVRETEERRYLSAGCGAYGAVSHLNLLLCLFERGSRQILMGPRVRADRHSGIDHSLSDLRMPARHLADLKESRF